MFNMDKFAQLLATKRKDKGLTQGQLSELVGVTHQAVSKWERGEAMPEISKIGDIAKALDTPTDELMSCLYGTENIIKEEAVADTADEAYFALEDKTRVGDLYALAPKLSKPVLEIAIDTLISAKGAAAASMLFRFADREYLSALGSVLFKQGDTRLAEYVSEDVLQSAIVDIISRDPELRTSLDRVGQLLTYCKDADFVYDMFDYMLARYTYWNNWRGYIGKFPSDAVVKQGIKMAITHGPSCFTNWWDIVGRRNIAKIFIGYVENYDKNNYRAWEDISRFYSYADSAIMEKYIKERLSDDETDPQILKPLFHRLSAELKSALTAKNVNPDQPQSNSNFAFGNSQKGGAYIDSQLIRDLVIAKIAEEISEIDIHELPNYLGRLQSLGINFGGFSETVNASFNESRIEDLESEIESRIEEMENDIEARLAELEERLSEME